MPKQRCALVYCLIISLAASPYLLASVNAQTTPTPAVPEFSVGVVNRSYDVPPTTTTTVDPYFGNQTTSTQPGYRVESYTIDVTIRNQPVGAHDELHDLYFSIRYKGHYESTWTEPFHITGEVNDNVLMEQSGTEFTVYSMPQKFPANASVDFQVEAFIAIGHIDFGPFGHWTWTESGWSPVQTITIANSSTAFSSSITNNPYPSIDPIITPKPSPSVRATWIYVSPSSTVPEFPVTTLLVALCAVMTLLLIISKRRTKRQLRKNVISSVK